MNRINFKDYRAKLYVWLRRSLIGPGSRGQAGFQGLGLKGISPLERYQVAILFPIVKGEDGLDPASEEIDREPEDGDLLAEDAGAGDGVTQVSQPKRRYTPPSSVGFSFFVRGDDVQLQLIPRAVRYRSGSFRGTDGHFQEQRWQRIPLGEYDSEVRTLSPPEIRQTRIWRESVFEDRAELFILWRPLADGWLATVSLSNTTELPEIREPRLWKRARNEHSLFEVGLSCTIDSGEVGPYPRVEYSLLGPEEQELELQYKDHRIYAIGHGAAVDWRTEGDRVAELWTDFLPGTEVPQVSADVGGAGAQVLDIAYLSAIDAGGEEICAALGGFVSSYRAWVQSSHTGTGGLSGLELATAERILARMDVAVERMRGGVELLRRDPQAARAFAIANRAMGMQMAQADRITGRPPRSYRWRPFQLAFLLLVVESTIDEDSEYRDTLDLIWFPTGGGKTEAYLGLMAFLIAWRRSRFPTTGGGTSILMRYTLRLLTKDQFRRAARLICALDLLRAECPDLGREPVSLGIWVGGASSPNSFKDAKQAVVQAIARADGRAPSWLVLESCPWCGEGFEAPQNYRASTTGFHFLCANPECEFGGPDQRPLPCNVVDEALYAAPPTLLIATVDKFARLAWEGRTSAFFGLSGNRPPELIVQDELHLIAGALGSVAGLYEAGLDTVLTLRGVRPKYIASTATIRMATEQVKRLYGREAAVFPPPGLSCDDSFFARTLPLDEKPGRLYLGYLAPALNRQHCMAPLAAALLSAPELLFDGVGADREVMLDAWWTLLVYHGSLKGVGTSRNAQLDIDRFWIRYQDEERELRVRAGQGADSAQWQRRERLAARIAQLTSNMTADENARTFERLRAQQDTPGVLDLVLATNMISVGLDVSRLATMIINGQPLTTAEYIQASSRVGRGEVPGIVIANYYRDQARSLSHYESFRAYHESFYRFVEPSSVTPYTYQARTRALHAALVIAIRHADGRLTANHAAAEFDSADSVIARIVERLKQRCRLADPERADATAAHIDALVAQWASAVRRAREQQSEGLCYQGKDDDRVNQRLLYSHDARVKGLWPTLNSMRNVENTALLKLL